MIGRTHVVVGLFVSLLFLLFTGSNDVLLFLVLGVVGSLLPDVDSAGSTFGKQSGFIPYIFSHRGVIHSVYVLFLFSLLVFLVFGLFPAFVFGTSFFSHLILDSFTKKGVSFFALGDRIRGSFVSGKLFDFLLFWVFLFSDIYLAIFML
ncbi:MAG: metal-dependent hydrolase [archaeon]